METNNAAPASVTVEVEMLAFMQGAVRPVVIPAHELTGDPILDLSAVFHYGQNDIQPLSFCSVSAGDVIRYQGARYLVDLYGFTPLAPEGQPAAMDAAHEEWEVPAPDEGRSLPDLPYGHPPTPDQCYDCGSYNVDGDNWETETRDLEFVFRIVHRDLGPGTAEVGPDPYVTTVSICPVCKILGPAPAGR